MVQFLKRLGRDERGATAVEYGLIIALIFLAIIGSVDAFGEEAIKMWKHISAEIDEAM